MLYVMPIVHDQEACLTSPQFKNIKWLGWCYPTIDKESETGGYPESESNSKKYLKEQIP
jgi:hypothetical protein